MFCSPSSALKNTKNDNSNDDESMSTFNFVKKTQTKKQTQKQINYDNNDYSDEQNDNYEYHDSNNNYNNENNNTNDNHDNGNDRKSDNKNFNSKLNSNFNSSLKMKVSNDSTDGTYPELPYILGFTSDLSIIREVSTAQYYPIFE